MSNYINHLFYICLSLFDSTKAIFYGYSEYIYIIHFMYHYT